MEIIQINPSDYGLTETKAAEVSAMFKPMLDKMEELEAEFNQVAEMANVEITEDVTNAAKEVRLKYVKVRTGTAKIHKDLKAFYLQGGRFVDGWKNAQLMASQGKEEKLKEIEEYFIRIEKERIASLQKDRATELSQYQEGNIPSDLGEMEESIWSHFIAGAKANHEARIEAERRAEEERIAREKEEAEERDRIRKENERLRAEAAERERLARIEAEKREKEEDERRAKEEAERKAREAEAMRIEEENRKRIEAERTAREAAEAEARKAREEADRIRREQEEEQARLKAEEEARIQAEKSKGDQEKVNDLIIDLSSLKTKYSFEADANREMYESVKGMIDNIVDYIQS